MDTFWGQELKVGLSAAAGLDSDVLLAALKRSPATAPLAAARAQELLADLLPAHYRHQVGKRTPFSSSLLAQPCSTPQKQHQGGPPRFSHSTCTSGLSSKPIAATLIATLIGAPAHAHK
jgi:hypothetical protein